YVPIDPSNPVERVHFLLNDAQATLLLTQAHLLPLVAGCATKAFCLDRDAYLLEQEVADNPIALTQVDDLAYVIYTSGSTGRPKGVLIEHRSVINHARALHDTVFANGAERNRRISFNAPLAFDSSVKQVGRLLFGDTLYLVAEETRKDPEELLAFLREEEIEVFDCTPSQLTQLVAHGFLDGRTPQVVLIGGEPIRQSLWQTLTEVSGCQFYNMYGPTECTVNATYCSIEAGMSKPSLGKPLPNVEVYVLDGVMEPVPFGVVGELYIGGAGLARGYWQRAEQTEERFVAHPFGQADERLYKTGDLVRPHADGTLEFVGRADDQVKIRGYRIEVGEIESQLVQVPHVAQAAVLARAGASGEKRLVAYLVPQAGETLDLQQVVQELKRSLPAYQVPAHFVVMEQFPVTANGKLNRAQLPTHVETVQSERFVEPRTGTEQQLAAIFAEVLDKEPIGAFDHFFEQGGNSLLATQAVVKMRSAFQIDVSLRLLFEKPVLAELAAAVDAAQLEQADDEKLSHLLDQLQDLSPEEIQLLLGGEGESE
ncbi:MAG: amino acid adenylation domain-containing protein, partial [Tumebacillaceae bacterium]